MVKIPPREPDTTPANLGNARHRTDYTDDDGRRCDKSKIGREGNEACTTKGKWNKGLQSW